MHLKELEVQGFKSFPDKVTMQFSSGITAIVGPNGSGKSNIVDAIRWVMGEQSSKTLRGARMEDVIFGGTQKRKPMGFSQVTLTVDNSEHSLPVDYDTVAITRRLYRSGESEYFINKKAVRLKDIHELLMDTGLGRDGYSIIGQGRIDEILSVKSTDRREIFEEAAGITKFRYRKEEAEHKLEATEENLVRIRDILTELEGQVEPLRLQSEKARRFLLLRDELRSLEVSVWMQQLETIHEEARKLKVDYENAERMLSARKRQLQEGYARSEALAEEMRRKESEAEQARLKEQQLKAQAAELKAAIGILEANAANEEENARRMKQELSAEESRGETLEQQRQQRLGRLKELEELIARQEETRDALLLKRAEQKKSLEEARKTCDEAEEALRLLQQQENALGVTAAALRSGVEEIQARSGTIIEEIDRAFEKRRQEQENARRLKQEIEQTKENEIAAGNRAGGFLLREKSRKDKLDQLMRQAEEQHRRHAAQADRLNLLQSLENEYEGFSRAVKEVLIAAEKGVLQGVHGPVSRLIVTKDEYAVAIEIALGGALSNIVTEKEENAKAAIGYLKQRQFGRATFLPLTAVKPRRSAQPRKEEPGFLGMADELVETKNEYRAVVSSLLGATAVMDTLDHAIDLAKKTKYQYRLVTLDGQLINPSGAMTGGSLNRSTGMLSRANEIARLRQQQEDAEKELQQLKQAVALAQQEYLKAQNERMISQQEETNAREALLGLEAQQKQHAVLLESMETAFAGLEKEQQSAGTRLEEIGKRLEELEWNRTELEQQQQEQSRQIGLAKSALLGQEKQVERLEAQQHEWQMQRAQAETQQAEARHSLEDLEALIEALQGGREEKEQRIAELYAHAEQLKAEKNGKREEAEAKEAAAGAQTETIAALLEAKMGLEARRVQAEKENQEQNNELLMMERERARLENKKEQAETEERQIFDKLWETYELTKTTAAAICIPLESLSAAQKSIARLKEESRKLGSINLEAIEEYEKVKERYEFLKAQREDLEHAKQELGGIIRDLTEQMKKIFASEFEKINENFQTTFVEIFGGGSATLILEDESDVLNCGIEIRVELPGKSCRAISLLSGGEKAFVAIALYFAILKVSPTPFCVLDEIEAALDDVNVQRYVEYMRRLCGNTQFILITHRRGTMEGADILYGVTMQEQGVTKLLPLQLDEIEKKLGKTANQTAGSRV